jgi:hypothetical protein
MADDMTEAEDELRGHQGIENHPYGRVFVRLARVTRNLVVRMKALEDRVKALEGR